MSNLLVIEYHYNYDSLIIYNEKRNSYDSSPLSGGMPIPVHLQEPNIGMPLFPKPNIALFCMGWGNSYVAMGWPRPTSSFYLLTCWANPLALDNHHDLVSIPRK